MAAGLGWEPAHPAPGCSSESRSNPIAWRTGAKADSDGHILHRRAMPECGQLPGQRMWLGMLVHTAVPCCAHRLLCLLWVF